MPYINLDGLIMGVAIIGIILFLLGLGAGWIL